MKLLRDKSGIYLLGAIASVHPVEIRGEARDQTKVTAVHTNIATIGGQTHNTTIPWDEASAAFEDYHKDTSAA
jgi:hypothetical protein